MSKEVIKNNVNPKVSKEFWLVCLYMNFKKNIIKKYKFKMDDPMWHTFKKNKFSNALILRRFLRI